MSSHKIKKEVIALAREKEIRCRGFIPDGSGGHRQLEELSPEERKEFSHQLKERLGKAMEAYFSEHPEVYAKI